MTERPLQFGDFEPEFRDPGTARIVLLPVPYDGTSTWVKGADCGPGAILKASYHLEFYDIETDSEVFREGVYTDAPIAAGVEAPEQVAVEVYQRMANWLDHGKFSVLLGGEHSVSIGAFRAMAERVGDLTILQLDAHSDLRDTYEGSPCNHACVMARAKEVAPIVQVGIRSMDIAEKSAMDRRRVFFAHQIQGRSRFDWIKDVVALLTDNVYLTIDLDAFDPSVLPATGTPEPGGLGWYDAIELVKAVCEHKNLVGFDVVELCPHSCHWGADFFAAKLIYKILTTTFCR
ncbi:MAG: agmatinase [Planctomycetes bacterium]|nr:agmatinase [Planctomycetota bacterium]